MHAVPHCQEEEEEEEEEEKYCERESAAPDYTHVLVNERERKFAYYLLYISYKSFM